MQRSSRAHQHLRPEITSQDEERSTQALQRARDGNVVLVLCSASESNGRRPECGGWRRRGSGQRLVQGSEALAASRSLQLTSMGSASSETPEMLATCALNASSFGAAYTAAGPPSLPNVLACGDAPATGRETLPTSPAVSRRELRHQRHTLFSALDKKISANRERPRSACKPIAACC
jgi:hypothetical protein